MYVQKLHIYHKPEKKVKCAYELCESAEMMAHDRLSSIIHHHSPPWAKFLCARVAIYFGYKIKIYVKWLSLDLGALVSEKMKLYIFLCFFQGQEQFCPKTTVISIFCFCFVFVFFTLFNYFIPFTSLILLKLIEDSKEVLLLGCKYQWSLLETEQNHYYDAYIMMQRKIAKIKALHINNISVIGQSQFWPHGPPRSVLKSSVSLFQNVKEQNQRHNLESKTYLPWFL